MNDVKCGWQLCDSQAVTVRDTPWGDLDVCMLHSGTPLFDDIDPHKSDREFLVWIKTATRLELLLTVEQVHDDWQVIAIYRELRFRP
jgi:hypothetical protein